MIEPVFPKRITEIVLEDGTKISEVMLFISGQELVMVNENGSMREASVTIKMSHESFTKFWNEK